ncbi:MAG: divalent-cation tolerance protein CutA [bacterium]|nr:divalent-cation tolerance protein CutA [bacterium]
MSFCILLLTCANQNEADKITNNLLDKKLIVCCKRFPLNSSFLWQGAKEVNSEVMLIMDSREDLFDEIEEEVRKLHSYKTFVLTALPISKTTKDVENWMNTELKPES